MHRETAIKTELDLKAGTLNETQQVDLSLNEMDITIRAKEVLIKKDKVKKDHDHSSCKGCDGICCKKKDNDKVHSQE